MLNAESAPEHVIAVRFTGKSAVGHAQALAFASELPPASPQPLHKVARIETGDPRVPAFRVRGTGGAADLDPMVKALRSALEGGGRIDVLVNVTDDEGLDPAVLATPELAALKLEAMRSVRRYAIVGAKGWMLRRARHFEAGDGTDALNWLRS